MGSKTLWEMEKMLVTGIVHSLDCFNSIFSLVVSAQGGLVKGKVFLIVDGAWIKITRRCASRTDQGVAWGCRWSWDNVGVFRNTCYCESDGCNGASSLRLNSLWASMLALVCLAVKRFL